MSGKGNKKKNTQGRSKSSKRKRNEADKLGDSLSKNERKIRRTRNRRQTKIYNNSIDEYAANVTKKKNLP